MFLFGTQNTELKIFDPQWLSSFSLFKIDFGNCTNKVSLQLQRKVSYIEPMVRKDCHYSSPFRTLNFNPNRTRASFVNWNFDSLTCSASHGESERPVFIEFVLELRTRELPHFLSKYNLYFVTHKWFSFGIGHFNFEHHNVTYNSSLCCDRVDVSTCESVVSNFNSVWDSHISQHGDAHSPRCCT